MMDQLAGASIEMLLCELCHELCVLPYSFTAHVPGMLWVFSTGTTTKTKLHCS